MKMPQDAPTNWPFPNDRNSQCGLAADLSDLNAMGFDPPKMDQRWARRWTKDGPGEKEEPANTAPLQRWVAAVLGGNASVLPSTRIQKHHTTRALLINI
jgi:hypothetical protein